MNIRFRFRTPLEHDVIREAARLDRRSVTQWLQCLLDREVDRLYEARYAQAEKESLESIVRTAKEEQAAGKVRANEEQTQAVREVYPKSVSPWGDRDRGVVPPAGNETAPPWAVPAGAAVPAVPFPRDLTMADAEALVREGMSKVGRRPGAGAGKR